MAAHRRTRQDKTVAQFRRKEELSYSLTGSSTSKKKSKLLQNTLRTPSTITKATDLLRYDVRLIGQDFLKTVVITVVLVIFLVLLYVRQQGWLVW